MKQKPILDAGEVLAWEAKPAPRCYTFRHWRHSIFGVLFLALTTFWLVMGMRMAGDYAIPWLAWLPWPFVLVGMYFAFGHLVQARIEWQNVYYAITDRRVLVQRGLLKARLQTLALSDLTYFSLHHQGDQLGTLRIHQGPECRLILHCVEHPRRATDLLEQAIKSNEARSAGSE